MKKTMLVVLLVVMLAFGTVQAYAGEKTVTVSNEKEFVSALEKSGDNTTIVLRDGTYRIDGQLIIDGKKNITIQSYDKETAVLTNSYAITGWKECKVNGKNALYAAAEGKRVSVLFSGESRLSCARLPQSGYYYLDTADTSDQKGSGQDLVSRGFFQSDITKAVSNTADVTVRILHQWVEEVDRLSSFDEKTGLVKLTRYTGRPIEDGDRYCLENVLEGLDKQGEWCYDSSSDRVYYIPYDGESAKTLCLYASAQAEFIKIKNSSGISFKSVEIKATGWDYPDESNLNTNIHTRNRDYHVCSMQGATDVCGTVTVTYSDNIGFERCEFTDIGVTAIKFFNGAKHCFVKNCRFNSIGGSAVYAGGRFYFFEDDDNNPADYAEDITVSNCEIAGYGQFFKGACGIMVTYCDTAEISHNEIHDGYYSGISAGYTWLYFDNPTQNIKINANLIYDIGLDTLSDLGGIYLLGVQQGTVVSENVIHDITCYDGDGGYAGNGIYLDSGCQYITVDRNLVYNCSTSGLNVTLNKENVFSNNISAFCGQSCLCLGVPEYAGVYLEQHSTYNNNILLTDDGACAVEYLCNKKHFTGSGNIIWDNTYGSRLYFAVGSASSCVLKSTARVKGLLKSAVFEEPGFTAADEYDFTLDESSYAVQNGFVTFDYTKAGTQNGSIIGISTAGGKTAYNEDVEQCDIQQATLPLLERIKQAISDFFADIANLFKRI